MQPTKIFNTVYKYILSLLMSFTFVYALAASLWSTFKHTYTHTDLALSVLLSFVLISIIFFNKRTLIVSGSILALALIAFIAYSFYNAQWSLYLDIFNEFTLWVQNFVNKRASLTLIYEILMMSLMSFGITLLVYYFTVKKYSFLVIALSGVAIFSSQVILKYIVSYPAFYSFLFLALIYYLLHIYFKNASKEYNDYISPYKFALWAIPLCLTVLLVSFMIPARSKPIQWKWLDTKVRYVNNLFYPKKNYNVFDFFSLSSSGFGEGDTKLGGRVRLDKTLVLKVYSPRIIYLKGTSKEIYTGSAWVSPDTKATPLPSNLRTSYSDISSSENVYRDYYESIVGPRYLNTSFTPYNSFTHNDEIEVTYENIKLKSLFVPLRASSIHFSSTPKPTVYYDERGIFTTKDQLKKGVSYKVSVANVDYDNEDFKEMLRKSYRGLYKNAQKDFYENVRNQAKPISQQLVSNANLGVYNQISVGGFFFEIIDIYSTPKLMVADPNGTATMLFLNSLTPLEVENQITNILTAYLGGESFQEPAKNNLITYAEGVYQKYLQLPDNLPTRVKDMAHVITDPFDNNYDKARAIEKYLSDNFPYTLNPPSRPRGQDFVDHFLFDGKEGYCVYYATAMTVLARSVGIPARYVEGYVLPGKTKNGNLFEVTNQQAHAWVEVYFEGFGWVPFEPTSPFGSNFYNNTNIVGRFSNQGTDAATAEYLRRLKGEGAISIDVDPVTPGGDSKKETDNKKKTYIPQIAVTASIVLVILLIFMMLFNAMKHRVRIRKLKRAEPRRSVLLLFKYYTKLLSLTGYGINPGETPSQYAERIDSCLIFSPVKFKEVTTIFSTARYSTIEISPENKKVLCDFMKTLLASTKERLGRFKFFIFKYILGKV
ncbi:MAG: hypothetical protein N2645_19215 [Clostridia bacterium]|nr:hypothetical protein [Clostridia bacterium]